MKKKITISFYGASVTQQGINQNGEMVGYVPYIKKNLEEKSLDCEFVFHQLGFGSNHLDDAGYLYFSKLLETSPDIVFLEWHTTGLAKFDSAKYDYIIKKLLDINCIVVNLILPFKRCIGKPERENIKQTRWYQEKGVRQINFYKLLDEKEIDKCLRDEVHTNMYGGLVYGKIISKVIEDILQGKQIVRDFGDMIAPVKNYLKAPKISSFILQRDLEQNENMLITYNPMGNPVQFFCESTIGPFSPILDIKYQNKTETIMIIDQWCAYERKCLKPISHTIDGEISTVEFSISSNNPLEKIELKHIKNKNLIDLRKMKNIEKIYCQGGRIMNIEITKRKNKVLIFANCHGAIYKHALEKADKEKILEIEHIISYENMDKFENIKHKFLECDILIIQPVQNYEEFKIENIQALLKKNSQLIRVPFVRFNGYWDEKDIKQLKKFTSSAVMFFPSIKYENEVEHYLKGNRSENEILKSFEKSIHDMRILEEQGDVKFVDFFLKHHQSLPFFRDYYHPTKIMYDYISHQIVESVRKNIPALIQTDFNLPSKLEKEYGHFKPIQDNVALILGLQYDLDSYWKYSRKTYLEGVLNYENSKNDKTINDLIYLSPILDMYQNKQKNMLEFDKKTIIKPFFTIVTVTYKDVWNLSKTMQSVMSQDKRLFEYIVIDGNSDDETNDLIDFWKNGAGESFIYIKEADTGVYDAMNKGIVKANGQYVCFMNAGDKFKNSQTLNIVYEKIKSLGKINAILGWGELGREVYAPWIESSDAYAMASLGFCHQSLYVKNEIIKQIKFDSRRGQTDSDTLQLANIIKKYGSISIINDVLAIRSDDPGISANMEKTKISIIKTISEYYDDIDEIEAEAIVDFRRNLQNIENMLVLFKTKSEETVFSIALMVLDTVILRPKNNQKITLEVENLVKNAIQFFNEHKNGSEVLTNLELVISKMKFHYEQLNNKQLLSSYRTKLLEENEQIRISKINFKRTTNTVVTLTSFPGRFKSLHLVLDSIFNQTVRPKKVILYLAISEIKNINWIPGNIKKFTKKGLEIVALEKNYFQYNKFYFASEINQDQPIITVDDDVIYPSVMIEKLLEFHKKYPNCVIANRAHEITYNDKGIMEPYVKWKKEIVKDKPSHELLATGVGGVLYPVGFINKYCKNTNDIMRTSAYADDVWLKITALKNNIEIMTTDLEKSVRWYCGYTPETSENALQEINVATGMNDRQFHAGLNIINFSKSRKISSFMENSNGSN